MFDVNVFNEGKNETPAKTFGYIEPIVKDKLKHLYASKEYAFAFHPGVFIGLRIVDEFSISTLLRTFTIVNVPIPKIPSAPVLPVSPLIPV